MQNNRRSTYVNQTKPLTTLSATESSNVEDIFGTVFGGSYSDDVSYLSTPRTDLARTVNGSRTADPGRVVISPVEPRVSPRSNRTCPPRSNVSPRVSPRSKATGCPNRVVPKCSKKVSPKVSPRVSHKGCPNKTVSKSPSKVSPRCPGSSRSNPQIISSNGSRKVSPRVSPRVSPNGSVRFNEAPGAPRKTRRSRPDTTLSSLRDRYEETVLDINDEVINHDEDILNMTVGELIEQYNSGSPSRAARLMAKAISESVSGVINADPIGTWFSVQMNR